jgi:hypothetical protein
MRYNGGTRRFRHRQAVMVSYKCHICERFIRFLICACRCLLLEP